MVERLHEYRAQGFVQYQMKVGERLHTDLARIEAVSDALAPGEILAADANTGWRQHEAIQVAHAVSDLPLYLEQPCRTYEECLAVRPHLRRPLILDEVMDSRTAIRRGAADGAMDLINLKISRFGGLSGARRARDLCVDLGKRPQGSRSSWWQIQPSRSSVQARNGSYVGPSQIWRTIAALAAASSASRSSIYFGMVAGPPARRKAHLPGCIDRSDE